MNEKNVFLIYFKNSNWFSIDQQGGKVLDPNSCFLNNLKPTEKIYS